MSIENNNVPEEILEEAEEVVEETAEETEEAAEEILEEAEAVMEEAPEDDKDIEALEKIVQEPKKAADPLAEKQKKTGFILITGIIVLAIIMAFAIFYAGREYKARMAAEAEAASMSEACHHINAHGYQSWSVHFRRGTTALEYYYFNEAGKEVKVSADEVSELIKEQVATVGDETLDNRMLQYYYADSLYEFSTVYGDYLMYIMDTSAPFDAQLNTMEENNSTNTWQKYFLQMALDRYHVTMAVLKDAQAKGFSLSEEDQAAYDEEMYYLDMMATSYGYPDLDTFIMDAMGPMASAESYKQYMHDLAVAQAYTEELTKQIEITPEKLNAYYDEHETDFTAQGITKDGQNAINVRHILIRPETAEDGTISDAAWAAAEKEAERILNEWKSGEATEESFGELAKTYTTDSGSAQTGGLYENVAPGQMVQPFNDWCFDETRQSGDTGIVKYHMEGHYSGYHVMYFVSESDQPYWEQVCEEAVLAEEVDALRNGLLEKYKMTANYGKIVIIDASTATVPTQDAAVTTEPAAQ